LRANHEIQSVGGLILAKIVIRKVRLAYSQWHKILELFEDQRYGFDYILNKCFSSLVLHHLTVSGVSMLIERFDKMWTQSLTGIPGPRNRSPARSVTS